MTWLVVALFGINVVIAVNVVQLERMHRRLSKLEGQDSGHE